MVVEEPCEFRGSLRAQAYGNPELSTICRGLFDLVYTNNPKKGIDLNLEGDQDGDV
jgi:hypothetical protein